MIGITKFNPLRAKADSFGFRRGYFLKSKVMNNTVLQEGSFSITKEQLRQLTDPKAKKWFPGVFSLSKDFTGRTITKSEAEKLLNKKIID